MRNWEKVLVQANTTIQNAVKILDETAIQIVLVVNQHQELLGTITDGDVRRGLLRHISLSAPVSEIMFRDPITIKEGVNIKSLKRLFKEYQILHLPVINGRGKVVGLETYRDHQDIISHKKNNAVFLMAGGFGTRLRPLTDTCPKPLLQIGSKPILEHILESFIAEGFHRFFISTHYMAERFRDYFGDGSDWNVSIQYIYEEQPLGTGGALGLLPREEINEPLFMMNGDILTNVSFSSMLDFHERNQANATLCVREYEHQIPFGVIRSQADDDCKVMDMVEKPTQKMLVNAGIYLLDPMLVKKVMPGQSIDMPTLLQQNMTSGNTVHMFPIHEYWLDIGRKEDFIKAQTAVLSMYGETNVYTGNYSRAN